MGLPALEDLPGELTSWPCSLLISTESQYLSLTLCFISGGLSAFKSGIEAIATPADIDNDFVNDIIARAKFYKRQSF